MRVPKVLRKPSSLLLATATAAAISAALPAQNAMANSCHWKVHWPSASVYPYPDRRNVSLKTKYQNDIVGPYCDQFYNSSLGETYTKVYCTCGYDGQTGWMRSAALVFAY